MVAGALPGAALPGVTGLEHPGYRKNTLDFRGNGEIAFRMAKVVEA